MARPLFLVLLVLCWIGVGHANAQSVDSSRVVEVFGLRVGAGSNPAHSGPNPIICPYYEVPAGKLLLSAELLVSFVSASTMSFPTYNESTLESYGFHALLRSTFHGDDKHYPDQFGFFAGGGLGFDVYRTEVSASIPLVFGDLLGLGGLTQLEVAARATPLFYFGERPGISYGLTVGLRFMNESR